MLQRSFILLLLFTSLTLAQQIGSVGDWPDWRGPDRDGISREKGLPEKWSLDGENLAWKAPYGGRSTPVVLGDHLYLREHRRQRRNRAGTRSCASTPIPASCFGNTSSTCIRAMCRRTAWPGPSPAADPETGNVYVFGVNNLLTALTKDGKKLWDRSITEEFSPFTTHGGRTVSPHHRRQPGDRQHAHLDLGHAWPTARSASSPSTSAPATSSGSAPRAAGLTTPATRP